MTNKFFTCATIVVSFVSIQALSAFALEIDGKYTYKEDGCSGDMTVSEVTGIDPYITVKGFTVCTSQSHTCDFDIRGERVFFDGKTLSTSFISKPDPIYDNESLKVAIDFTKYGAKVNNEEGHNQICGMNGSIGGKWIKNGVKQPDHKKDATEKCSEYMKFKKECFHKAKKGVMMDKALMSLKKSKFSEEARDNACREGYTAFGKVGNVKESVLNQAIQQQFTQCYDELIKSAE